MVEVISENHHNAHTRQNTSNVNSTFRIKTNYQKLFPLEKKNIVLIFETRRSVKSSNGNEALNKVLFINLLRFTPLRTHIEQLIEQSKEDQKFIKEIFHVNALNILTNEKHFPKTISHRVGLLLVYTITENNFRSQLHSDSKEVCFLPWQSKYFNMETTCRIQPKIFRMN